VFLIEQLQPWHSNRLSRLAAWGAAVCCAG